TITRSRIRCSSVPLRVTFRSGTLLPAISYIRISRPLTASALPVRDPDRRAGVSHLTEMLPGAQSSQRAGGYMLTKFTRGAARQWLGLAAVASVMATSGYAYAQAEQQELVNAAETTFSNFIRAPD